LPERVTLGKEPIAVLRSLVAIKQVLERGELIASMIEDAIQDNTHTPLMKGGDQFLQRSITAKARVDRIVIGGVVFMIGR